MRVAIVTSRRYHLLDLARELLAAGHEVDFFSCVPWRKAEEAGLPRRSFHGLTRATLPVLAAQALGPERWERHLGPMLQRVADRSATRRLGPCDAFIGLSGTSVRSLAKARTRYGATIFVERGGRHVLSQKDILEQVPASPRPAITHVEIKRELWGYANADVVVVASRHAADSFIQRGIPAERVFRNPYGVDLEKFGPTARIGDPLPTLLYVGTWSMVNGCDLLAQAVRGMKCRLLHVGPRGNAPRPEVARFDQREMVEDWELCQIFREVDVLVRPARGEGLGMVQAQALACGVPVVGTDRSGAADLRDFIEDPAAIVIAKAANLETLRDGIAYGFAYAAKRKGRRSLMTEGRARLSWEAYGARYDAELHRRVPEKLGAAASAKAPVVHGVPSAFPAQG